MNDREKTYLRKFWNDIQQAGDILRNQEPPELTEDAFFLFEKTGNRLVYENAYFTRRKYLTVFGILSKFGKKESDIKALNQIILSIYNVIDYCSQTQAVYDHLWNCSYPINELLHSFLDLFTGVKKYVVYY